MSAQRIKQLERTLLEMGSDLFRLKTEISTIKTNHDNQLNILNGLKKLLDEKGLILEEDFENAVDLGNAIDFGSAFSRDVQSIEEEIEKIKKTSH